MVFAGIFPVNTDDFEELRDCMDKLQLNDASLTLNWKLHRLWALVFVAAFSVCCIWKLYRNVWKESLIKRLLPLFPTLVLLHILQKGKR